MLWDMVWWSFQKRINTIDGAIANPARASQLDDEVTPARSPAAPTVSTQAAAIVAFVFLRVINQLYAVRHDRDVPKGTPEGRVNRAGRR